MTDEERFDLRDELNERLVDVRNDLIIQGANLYLLARKATLIGLGAAATAMDEAGAILERFEDRGEVANDDIQAEVNSVRTRLERRAEAANQAREEMTEKAMVALEHNLEIIRSVLRLPGGHETATSQDVPVQTDKGGSDNPERNA